MKILFYVCNVNKHNQIWVNHCERKYGKPLVLLAAFTLKTTKIQLLQLIEPRPNDPKSL